MLGPDFHESVPPEASLWVPGSAGISLHAGPYGGGYTVRGDGALACEQVNVAWQLRDVTAADGGFVSSTLDRSADTSSVCCLRVLDRSADTCSVC